MSNNLLGSVQYSILEPNTFVQVNGDGWVLMDGRDIQGSALFGLTGITTLPDARGVFIRSMNENRDPNSGDADGNRAIGNYQGDEFRLHNHDVSYSNNVYPNETSGMGIQSDHGPQIQWTKLNISIGNRGGNETRPKNVCLYLYIKIN